MKQDAVFLGNPKKKYRIIIQKRSIKGDNKEAARSFMIYDMIGSSTIDRVTKKLKEVKTI